MKFLDVHRREGCQDMSSKEKDAVLASPAVTREAQYPVGPADL